MSLVSMSVMHVGEMSVPVHDGFVSVCMCVRLGAIPLKIIAAAHFISVQKVRPAIHLPCYIANTSCITQIGEQSSNNIMHSSHCQIFFGML